MEKWLFESIASRHQGVLTVSEEFDVSVYYSAEWSAHADVCTNPCWEKEEFVFEQVPF